MDTVDDLSTFNIDGVSDDLTQKIEKYNFIIEEIQKESKAAGILA